MTETRHLDPQAALVVDDEPLIALDIAATLKDLGYTSVEIAGDLVLAKAKFVEVHPTIAVLDVNLGAGVDSVEFGRELSSLGVTVVFSSGYGLTELPADVAKYSFIEKPISREALRNLVKAAGR